MDATDTLIFYVNGRKIVEARPDPEATLLHYLRRNLRLTGTKLVCGEGGCGACTVMVSKYDKQSDKIFHYSVNACLTPLCSVHGLAVTTVEGIGSTKTRLHPVQERLAKSHGSQCGFCTPGMVMSMYTLLRNKPDPTLEDVESNFDGNLCRCTGYRPILAGFRTFVKGFVCQMGDQCCRNTGNEVQQKGHVVDGQVENGDITNGASTNGNEEILSEVMESYDPSQEPIFPPDLKLNVDKYNSKCVTFKSDRVTWIRPICLEELLSLKEEHPEAKLVIGNTEIGIETKFKNMNYPVLISATHVQELTAVQYMDSGVKFGASVTLAKIEEVLVDQIRNNPEYKSRVFSAVVEMLKWFAGHQIRNVAAVGGNIMTASPISDLNPLFMAAGAELAVVSKENGWRTLKMDENFFKGYRKTAINPDELLVSITVPYSKENEYFCGYKQAHRKDDDIAIVNAGMRVLLERGSNIIKDMSLAFGGMAPVTVMAKKTIDGLVGSRWDDSLVTKACNLLAEDLPLSPGAPGGMVEFRRTLTSSFFFKFYLTVQNRLQEGGDPRDNMQLSFKSATASFCRDISKGSQVFEEIPEGQLKQDAVGRPLVHKSASQQTTGEAMYLDDMPKIEGELFMAFVTSQKAHAKITSVDATEALSMSGVVDFISRKDLPGQNTWGAVKPNDEEIFATDKVLCQGQVIGGILAETKTEAQRAAKKVKVEYNELEPIITIKEAIEKNSFLSPPRIVQNGDLEAGFSKSDHIVEGEVSLGGQNHFYFETQSNIAIPKNEDGGMEILTNSQHPGQIQLVVAKNLNIDANKVVVKVKRIGGGFGGKETRTAATAIPVAVAAAKHGRAVRSILDRDEDMVMTGSRHPYLGKYKVGFTKSGKILALDVELYSNCGISFDLSDAVLGRAMFHSENSYNIPNIRVTGRLCKTNLPSNTAMRGFGGPQSMMIAETWISHVAGFLKIPPEEIREMNLYRDGDLTYYLQPIEGCNMQRVWQECKEKSEFQRRKELVKQFNRENRWHKRGIALTPVKYGLSYPAVIKFLNQGAALVIVYLDGSVLLTHGGTEMGQGLHTKMIQIASRVLRIPHTRIYINENSTDKVPNTSASAASTGSDLYGAAVQNACEIIYQRLEPYITANPKGSWNDWVKAAYLDRIQLSATGFFKTPGLDYERGKKGGHYFNYFVCGTACSEVEIDCLTGDHQVLRTDIVMDVGQSLNPTIDIGQIEGAFMMGYGEFVLEQPKVTPDGTLLTRGPGTYKIPGFGNIPVEFNVSLLKGSTNKRAVYSSKGIGEPPLFLAASVFFAIKDAIMSARSDAGHSCIFTLGVPATPERIRMACEDQFTQQFPSAPQGTFKPWFVDLS